MGVRVAVLFHFQLLKQEHVMSWGTSREWEGKREGFQVSDLDSTPALPFWSCMTLTDCLPSAMVSTSVIATVQPFCEGEIR